MTDAVVIGYGNDLRRDDGAGRWVAAQIEARALPGVVVRSVSQLTPELALEIADRDMVIFVDADVDVTETTVTPAVAAAEAPRPLTHHGDPAGVLALVPTIGEPPAHAFVISIPATDLDMGLELTPPTAAAAAEAVERIVELVYRDVE